MPFTTKEIVRKHVLEHHIGSNVVTNESICMTAADPNHLQGRPILPQSETVKAREQNEPTGEAVSFAQGDMAPLTHAQLVLESVVVASDTSLGRVYVEHIDYHVDYEQGTIRRLSAGAIPSGAVVTAWYIPYRIYQRGVDYDIDYQDGTLRRRSSGAIEAGQQVLADYTAEYGNLDDAAIDNAITEANEQVVAFIDEQYRNSSEKALVAAETYLAVAIICRIKSMELMSGAGGPGSGDARSWIAVAEMYRKEAFGLMARFAKSVGAFKSPGTA
jgi:hypothetical protein